MIRDGEFGATNFTIYPIYYEIPSTNPLSSGISFSSIYKKIIIADAIGV